jgi:hypothetical protein
MRRANSAALAVVSFVIAALSPDRALEIYAQMFGSEL